ncbi:glycosyltransferase [Scytonema sp. UIC 10036]|uniref:glycosyltransferase family 2 protein n=1 Tax=Scytonema sp. UIC 10036 TaxID=2304196 RepID=UPI0012DADAF9|nr:glycosyltransferase family 2 protein [Scytonema sp. UIC 10036]MUG99150.1 glycosyltransferase [Scytonema sp. UIC 10036]
MSVISVVIPAYNAERTIWETIDSVLKQSFQDFELIVINDGSKDRTLEIVRSIQDERVKIFSYDNGGLPVARNRGISHATGEYIAFLDADDLWTPDKLELQLAALQQHPEAGVAYSWTVCMIEEGEALSYRQLPPTTFTGNIYSELLQSNFIAHGSNVLVRREAVDSVGDFDPACTSCADWDYWLRLAARWQYVLVPQNQIFYRRTLGSMSSNVEVMEERGLFMIEKAYREAPSELQYLKSQTMSNFYRYCAELCLEYRPSMSGIRKAQGKLWTAIRIHPQILLDLSIWKLIAKLIMRLLFTQKIASLLLRVNRQMSTQYDSRLQLDK